MDTRFSTSVNVLECNVCKQRFKLTSEFMDHMKTHQRLLLSCNICNKSFFDQKLLDQHYLVHKEVISTYECRKCPRKFLKRSQFEKHIEFHLSNEISAKETKAMRRIPKSLDNQPASDDIDSLNTLKNKVFKDDVTELLSIKNEVSLVTASSYRQNPNLMFETSEVCDDSNVLYEVEVEDNNNKLNEQNYHSASSCVLLDNNCNKDDIDDGLDGSNGILSKMKGNQSKPEYIASRSERNSDDNLENHNNSKYRTHDEHYIPDKRKSKLRISDKKKVNCSKPDYIASRSEESSKGESESMDNSDYVITEPPDKDYEPEMKKKGNGQSGIHRQQKTNKSKPKSIASRSRNSMSDESQKEDCSDDEICGTSDDDYVLEKRKRRPFKKVKESGIKKQKFAYKKATHQQSPFQSIEEKTSVSPAILDEVAVCSSPKNRPCLTDGKKKGVHSTKRKAPRKRKISRNEDVCSDSSAETLPGKEISENGTDSDESENFATSDEDYIPVAKIKQKSQTTKKNDKTSKKKQNKNTKSSKKSERLSVKHIESAHRSEIATIVAAPSNKSTNKAFPASKCNYTSSSHATGNLTSDSQQAAKPKALSAAEKARRLRKPVQLDFKIEMSEKRLLEYTQKKLSNNVQKQLFAKNKTTCKASKSKETSAEIQENDVINERKKKISRNKDVCTDSSAESLPGNEIHEDSTDSDQDESKIFETSDEDYIPIAKNKQKCQTMKNVDKTSRKNIKSSKKSECLNVKHLEPAHQSETATIAAAVSSNENTNSIFQTSKNDNNAKSPATENLTSDSKKEAKSKTLSAAEKARRLRKPVQHDFKFEMSKELLLERMQNRLSINVQKKLFDKNKTPCKGSKSEKNDAKNQENSVINERKRKISGNKDVCTDSGAETLPGNEIPKDCTDSCCRLVVQYGSETSDDDYIPEGKNKQNLSTMKKIDKTCKKRRNKNIKLSEKPECLNVRHLEPAYQSEIAAIAAAVSSNKNTDNVFQASKNDNNSSSQATAKENNGINERKRNISMNKNVLTDSSAESLPADKILKDCTDSNQDESENFETSEDSTDSYQDESESFETSDEDYIPVTKNKRKCQIIKKNVKTRGKRQNKNTKSSEKLEHLNVKHLEPVHQSETATMAAAVSSNENTNSIFQTSKNDNNAKSQATENLTSDSKKESKTLSAAEKARRLRKPVQHDFKFEMSEELLLKRKQNKLSDKAQKILLDKDERTCKASSSEETSAVHQENNVILTDKAPVLVKNNVVKTDTPPVLLVNNVIIVKNNSHYTEIDSKLVSSLSSKMLNSEVMNQLKNTIQTNYIVQPQIPTPLSSKNMPVASYSITASAPSKADNVLGASNNIFKKFLYVGPQQDLGEVKSVIEELKNQPNDSLGQIIHKPATVIPDSPGILEKKSYKNYTFVKVTPELMEEIKKKSSQANCSLEPSLMKSNYASIPSQNSLSINSPISKEKLSSSNKTKFTSLKESDINDEPGLSNLNSTVPCQNNQSSVKPILKAKTVSKTDSHQNTLLRTDLKRSLGVEKNSQSCSALDTDSSFKIDDVDEPSTISYSDITDLWKIINARDPEKTPETSTSLDLSLVSSNKNNLHPGELPDINAHFQNSAVNSDVVTLLQTGRTGLKSTVSKLSKKDPVHETPIQADLAEQYNNDASNQGSKDVLHVDMDFEDSDTDSVIRFINEDASESEGQGCAPIKYFDRYKAAVMKDVIKVIVNEASPGLTDDLSSKMVTKICDNSNDSTIIQLENTKDINNKVPLILPNTGSKMLVKKCNEAYVQHIENPLVKKQTVKKLTKKSSPRKKSPRVIIETSDITKYKSLRNLGELPGGDIVVSSSLVPSLKANINSGLLQTGPVQIYSDKSKINHDNISSDAHEHSISDIHIVDVRSVRDQDPTLKLTPKVLRLFEAKMEEKEQRKEEKYKLKKKIRYLEKILSKKIVTNLQPPPNHAAKNPTSTYSKAEAVKKRLGKDSIVSSNLIHSTDTAKEKGLKRVQDICLEIEKNFQETDSLAKFHEMHSIISNLNLWGKCQFVFRTLRFCRLNAKSYAMKECALSLHKRITKAMKDPLVV